MGNEARSRNGMLGILAFTIMYFICCNLPKALKCSTSADTFTALSPASRTVPGMYRVTIHILKYVEHRMKFQKSKLLHMSQFIDPKSNSNS